MRSFTKLRSKPEEKKLPEKSTARTSSLALATVELEVKELDKAGVADMEVEGASRQPMPDAEVSSFELVLQQHESRLLSIGH